MLLQLLTETADKLNDKLNVNLLLQTLDHITILGNEDISIIFHDGTEIEY